MPIGGIFLFAILCGGIFRIQTLIVQIHTTFYFFLQKCPFSDIIHLATTPRLVQKGGEIQYDNICIIFTLYYGKYSCLLYLQMVGWRWQKVACLRSKPPYHNGTEKPRRSYLRGFSTTSMTICIILPTGIIAYADTKINIPKSYFLSFTKISKHISIRVFPRNRPLTFP